MPVAVTGAGGFVGSALVPRLVGIASEVRALVRDPVRAPALRAAGAKVAVADVDDEDTLFAVLHDVHTVCHLVGGLYVPEGAHREANLDSVEAVLAVAGRSGARRILFVSHPGADPASDNAFLRAKGQAEEAVRASGLEHVILRPTHLVGPAAPWVRAIAALAARRPSIVVGTGGQRVAPLALDDLVSVLVAADDRAAPPAGTFGLGGPDTLTLEETAEAVAGRRRWRRRLDRPPGVPPTVADVLARDCLVDAPDAAEAFGIEPAPVLTRLPEAAAASG